MHAGASSAGADDAWWSTALRLEEAKIDGDNFTGGSADIHKCFDQVLRELLYILLGLGGMPPR
eukprot:6290730-Heterocapsa_arctica.AAC.1